MIYFYNTVQFLFVDHSMQAIEPGFLHRNIFLLSISCKRNFGIAQDEPMPEPLYHAIQNVEEQLLSDASPSNVHEQFIHACYIVLYYNVICVTTEREFLELRWETHEDIVLIVSALLRLTFTFIEKL